MNMEGHLSDDMTALVSKVESEIKELRRLKYSCSQATFVGICKAIGCERSNEELMALSAGFRGGIGCSYNEGPCGAFAAGVMALGMYLPKDNAKAITLSHELFCHFKRRLGTVICGNIVYLHGFGECTRCCLCVGEKVTELLCREHVSIQKNNKSNNV
ncbi:MAG: C-GCAxxG-C-C family protein [Bacteroides sp.]|nr:C-GCAxxG-C-C family protein [Bacteroides sp.]